jgi:hypothetical protein
MRNQSGLSITGARSELGRVLARRQVQRHLHINVAGQQANTLLHDGHAWRGFARAMVDGTRRAMRSEASLLVHASFAFVQVLPSRDPLRSIAQTILECEQRVLSGPLPGVVVRLGYLYGPDSADLRAYRTAFRIGRPYWAGPRGALQHHLHVDDAADALLAAARPRHAGRLLYATGAAPASFMRFMDDFARRMGRRFPLHVPTIAKPAIRLIVRDEHMQQVALAMPDGVPSPRVPGWQPVYADHGRGFDQIAAAWSSEA